ncbi:MAG: radical SAM protein, partial [Methylocystis sp.]|nr:radical SAM protein [Methylocystis sp.]
MSAEAFATAPPSLMQALGEKALRLGVPISAHLDLTYRCNERCIHCYLDHEDHGEMTTAEILDLIDQLAAAGTLFLTLSGGEILMRRDFFDILGHARRHSFCVKLKTNGLLIREDQAARIAESNVDSVQISIYSHRDEVHDAITKRPASLRRSLHAARLLRDKGVKVFFANVLMKGNEKDFPGVRALAAEIGAIFTIDPTITPMMDGDRGVLALNIDRALLREVMRDATLNGPAELCAAPKGPLDAASAAESLPCSAGHTGCYISPYGDVYPCVQFPLPCGNVRTAKFADIWKNSPQLAEVRSITVSDLKGCSSCVHGANCSRCPGLAYMEGDM